MLADETQVDSFHVFVVEVEPRLRAALTASFGPEMGGDMTSEALMYGWEHWDRVSTMDNPAGYLFTVGRSKGRRASSSKRVMLPSVTSARVPWVEPGLPTALASLSDRQRTVVALHHGYEWSLTEIAEVLGLSKASVQNHQRRGMRKLQQKLRALHD